MFITRKRFEQELRKAELKGRKEKRLETKRDAYINDLKEDMWNYCGNIAKECDIINNRIGRIEKYIGMCSDKKVN